MSNLDALLYAADILDAEVKRRQQLQTKGNINLGKRAYPFTLQLATPTGIVGRIGSTSPTHSEVSCEASEAMYSSDSNSNSSNSRRASTCAGSDDSQPRKKSRYVKRDAVSRLEHNQSEKCRRAQLRERLDVLATLVPNEESEPVPSVCKSTAANERKTTLNLLNRAVDYIKTMQTRAIEQQSAKDQLASRNEQLKARLLELTSRRITDVKPDIAESEEIDVVTVSESPITLVPRSSVIVSPLFGAHLGEGSFARFQSPQIPAELILSMCGIN